MKHLSVFVVYCISLFLSSEASLAGKLPSWVTAPQDFCGDEFVCAVGEAEGALMAKAKARQELVKVFGVNVKSQNSVNTYSDSTSSGDYVKGEVDQRFTNLLTESTALTMEGIKIEKVFESKDGYFALAKLERAKEARRVKKELVELDELNEVLLRDGRRTSLGKIKRGLSIRKDLASRLRILRGSSPKSPVSLGEVESKLNSLSKNAAKLHLKVDSEIDEKEFRSFLIKKLTDQRFKIVKQVRDPSIILLTANIKHSPAYLNVKGFERYKFELTMKSKKQNGEVLGGLQFKHTLIARNLTQARNNVIKKIEEYIDQNLDLLNME